LSTYLIIRGFFIIRYYVCVDALSSEVEGKVRHWKQRCLHESDSLPKALNSPRSGSWLACYSNCVCPCDNLSVTLVRDERRWATSFASRQPPLSLLAHRH